MRLRNYTDTPPSDLIGCAGNCGRRSEDPEKDGWDYLQLTKRFRCGQCTRELGLAGVMTGAEHDPGKDDLPPTSRGALKALPERSPLKEGAKP